MPPTVALCCPIVPPGHVHILECHPTDPSLAFSASYDGTLLLWSTLSGAVLRRFSRQAGWLLGVNDLRHFSQGDRRGCPNWPGASEWQHVIQQISPGPLLLVAARRAPTAAAGPTCCPLRTGTSPQMGAPSRWQVGAVCAILLFAGLGMAHVLPLQLDP